MLVLPLVRLRAKNKFVMKKSSFLVILICLLSVQIKAQVTRIDTVAVAILDRMSAFMGELKSCSAVIKSNYDVGNQELGLIKHADEEHLYMSGSNKLYVSAEGDKGSRNFLYNGKTFTYYSLTKNHYAQIPAPATTIAMIDTMNKVYGIVFPAADFMYPAFVDDILAEASNLALLGMAKVDGKDCFHIAGVAKDKTFQFWVADAPFYLPVKLVIVYTEKPGNPQFEAIYTDWQINPSLPDGIFEFKTPPNAKKIKLKLAAEKK